MQNKIIIPDTKLQVYPIGLGTAGAGLGWDHEEADRVKHDVAEGYETL